MRFPAKDISEGEILPLDEKICIAKINGQLKAFSRFCTHEGADLSQGYVEQGKVRCAWHNLPFDPETGSPPCKSIKNLKVYSVQLVDREFELTPQQ
jgi:nitrite reductase/ring-hydroxylating ferredoxin subunit